MSDNFEKENNNTYQYLFLENELKNIFKSKSGGFRIFFYYFYFCDFKDCNIYNFY